MHDDQSLIMVALGNKGKHRSYDRKFSPTCQGANSLNSTSRSQSFSAAPNVLVITAPIAKKELFE